MLKPLSIETPFNRRYLLAINCFFLVLALVGLLAFKTGASLSAGLSLLLLFSILMLKVNTLKVDVVQGLRFDGHHWFVFGRNIEKIKLDTFQNLFKCPFGVVIRLKFEGKKTLLFLLRRNYTEREYRAFMRQIARL